MPLGSNLASPKGSLFSLSFIEKTISPLKLSYLKNLHKNETYSDISNIIVLGGVIRSWLATKGTLGRLACKFIRILSVAQF